VVTESRFDQERRWLTDMERLGPRGVRARLRDGKPVTDQAPYAELPFVEEWLSRKDHDARHRLTLYCALLVLISVAIIMTASWFGL
jgi:hypothetical protein